MVKTYKEWLDDWNEFLDKSHIRLYCQSVCLGNCCKQHTAEQQKKQAYKCNESLFCTMFLCGSIIDIILNIFKINTEEKKFKTYKEAYETHRQIKEYIQQIYNNHIEIFTDSYFSNIDLTQLYNKQIISDIPFFFKYHQLIAKQINLLITNNTNISKYQIRYHNKVQYDL